MQGKGLSRRGVIHSAHPSEKIEAHTLKYRIPVPREGSAKLTYRVRLRF